MSVHIFHISIWHYLNIHLSNLIQNTGKKLQQKDSFINIILLLSFLIIINFRIYKAIIMPVHFLDDEIKSLRLGLLRIFNHSQRDEVKNLSGSHDIKFPFFRKKSFTLDTSLQRKSRDLGWSHSTLCDTSMTYT